MEIPGYTPVFEAFRDRVLEIAKKRDDESGDQTRVQTHFLSEVEKLLSGKEHCLNYIFNIEWFHTNGKPWDTRQGEITEAIKEVFELEQISHKDAERPGFAETTAYKTNLNRIFVVNSKLVKPNGLSSAWIFERIEPGHEAEHTWLPEGYFDTAQS